jgi:hypothetical protein
MRPPAIRKKSAASFEDLKPVCPILILHEDFPAYTQAVEVCRLMMEQFASELEFDIKCWNFIELGDPNCARHVAKSAGMADIILLSTRSVELPVELDRWLDTSVERFKPDGLLALLVNTPPVATPEAHPLRQRLEQWTRRQGMDFISLMAGHEAMAASLLPSLMVRFENRQ